MTSPLPPRNRDTVALADLIRQHKTNHAQTNVGFMGGRMPMLRPLGAAALFGDLEADDEADEESEQEFLRFNNTDQVTAFADNATTTLVLTNEPIPESLHVRQNGVDLLSSEWALNSNRVTIPASTGVTIRTGDVFHAAYAYDQPGEAPVLPVWRDTAPQNLNGFLIPDDAEVEDLLVFVAMMPSSESVTNANGFALVGVSDYVSHEATGGGPRVYRLEVYAGPNDGSTVPTVSNIAAQDVVCSTTAFENGVDVSGTFSTLADGTSANAPALNPTSLRVWGTIGDTITITPGRGSVVLSTNYLEIDIAMTIDADPTTAPATASGAAGWCMASLAVSA